MRTKGSRLHRPFFFLALLLLTSCSGSALVLSPVEGQVVYVDQNAPGPEHDGTSWDTAFLTIQEGVDAATPGGEVWVADATYVENVVMGEGVAIYGGFLGAEPGGYEDSLDQRDWVNHVTTIDGNQSGSCVTMASGSRADGFTITNGLGTVGEYGYRYGAGIYCVLAADPVILSNTIVSNATDENGAGGAIYCEASSPIIANNVIAWNSAGFGAGVVLYTSSAAVTNNTLFGNVAGYRGGGFFCVEGGEPSISNNIVFANGAGQYGGGICCENCTPVLSHNDLWINAPDNYYGCLPGSGDVSIDPQFVDPENGDFHLAPDSPCMDIGDNAAPGLPERDFEGDPRVTDGDGDGDDEVDIGADEWAGVVAMIDLPTDDVTIAEGESVELAGTATDWDGYIVDWLWTFGEGSGVDDMHAEDPGLVQFNNAGVFTVTFNARDNDGNWDPTPDTRIVTVLSPLVYVDRDSPGPVHDGTSWDTAHLTIQAGVNACRGQVWVADGTYVENVVMGEGVAIYGGFLGAEPGGYETSLGQRNWENHVTTIDGSQSGSCVVIAVYACVDGFTITNGSGTLVSGYRRGGGFYCQDMWATGTIANNTITGNSASYGGGIYCYYSSPTVTNNTVTGNTAGGNGGGICCEYDSSPTVAGSPITGNSAGGNGGGMFCCYNSSPAVTAGPITGNSASYSGGGMYCSSYSSPTVTNTTITDNSAGGIAVGGGGICISDHSSPTVTNSTITGNSASNGPGGGICISDHSSSTITNNVITGNEAYYDYGGGIYCEYDSSPTVTNNTIVGNSSLQGGGIMCNRSSPAVSNNIVAWNSAPEGGGICAKNNSFPELSHNDFWENTPDDYYGCEPGQGDISADPMFVNLDTGDFHLTADSPCVDAGDNSAPYLPGLDWDGEDRVANEFVDIGTDEYVTISTEAPVPQPECGGPLFGGSQNGFPAWVWFSIPLSPDCVAGAGCDDPDTLLGFSCGGRLWYFDKYAKAAVPYQPPFLTWELAVGNSYLLYLEADVANPGYEGIRPFIPWTFEFKLGRMGWTWIGTPGLAERTGAAFMSSVRVKYPSDETGEYRTAQVDYDATPDNWLTWGWPYWNTWLQAPETFTPYAPFGHDTCYPWIGYRVWINVGTAQSEDDADQVTLIWPCTGG